MNDIETNPERRIVLQGNPSPDQLQEISEVAIKLGLRMVAYTRQAVETSVPEELAEQDRGQESAVHAVEQAPDNSEQEPIRKPGSKLSFQKFVYENYVDHTADKFTQRAHKGSGTVIWTALAAAQFADQTKSHRLVALINPVRHELSAPLDPRPLLGVGLPRYGYVPQESDRVVRTGERYTYTDVANCDDIDLDGLARYVVAAAKRVEDLAKFGSPRSDQTRRNFKKFIPDGIGMPSMKILTEYCAEMLHGDEEAAVTQEALRTAAQVFSRLSEQ